MKILVLGDLHGQQPEIAFSDFDIVVAPGDFCSDGARPYAFQALEANARHTGPPLAWHDFLSRPEAEALVRQSLADGRKVLERLDALGVPVMVVPGNGDWLPTPDVDWELLRSDHFTGLLSGLGHVHPIDHRAVVIGGLAFVGYGGSAGPEIPQSPEDHGQRSAVEAAEGEARYRSHLAALTRCLQTPADGAVLVSHNVPFDTPLDLIQDPRSPRCGLHFGSVVARQLIESTHPLICIGGHMHEHFGMCRIADTIVINAGFGRHVNTLIEIEDFAVRRIRFHGGIPSVYP